MTLSQDRALRAARNLLLTAKRLSSEIEGFVADFDEEVLAAAGPPSKQMPFIRLITLSCQLQDDLVNFTATRMSATDEAFSEMKAVVGLLRSSIEERKADEKLASLNKDS